MRTWFTALCLVAASSIGHLVGEDGRTSRRWPEDRVIPWSAHPPHDEDKDGLLKGIVEADETYLGSKASKKCRKFLPGADR